MFWIMWGWRSIYTDEQLCFEERNWGAQRVRWILLYHKMVEERAFRSAVTRRLYYLVEHRSPISLSWKAYIWDDIGVPCGKVKWLCVSSWPCYHDVCGGLILVSRSNMYSSRGCVVISPGCDISRWRCEHVHCVGFQRVRELVSQSVSN